MLRYLSEPILQGSTFSDPSPFNKEGIMLTQAPGLRFPR
jgi:hypothetical protein